MTPALARRRNAKAQRRKAQTASKRRDSRLDASLPELVRRAAAGPIHCCFVQDGLFDRGNGTVILARTTPDGALVMASFLLDVHCLGAKDVMLCLVSPDELDLVVSVMDRLDTMAAVDPARARKLVRDSVAFARSIGFAPHRDYARAEQLFGDICADTCDATFSFGIDGKPVYVPGPGETAGQIGRRVQALAQRLGPDGFHMALPTDVDESSAAFDAPIA